MLASLIPFFVDISRVYGAVQSVIESGVRDHRGIQTIFFEVVLCAIRIFFLALLIASPWYYGSVSWLCQSTYVPLVMLAFALSLGVAAIQGYRWENPFVWSFGALLVIAVLQTIPLPSAIWNGSAGAAFERSIQSDFALFSDQLTSSAEGGAPAQIVLNRTPKTWSIHWVQTRASASTLAMALAWIISASILFRTQKWELVLTLVLGVGGIAIAVIGLMQLVAWNHWTLLPMPTGSFFATFVSRNSAPQFLAVGLGGLMGTLVWWSHTKSDNTGKKYYVRYPAVNLLARFRRRLDDLVIDVDPLSIVLILSITLLYVATLASASRGGIVASCAASVITLVFSLNASRNILRTVALITLIVCVGLLLLTSLDLDTAIVERMATMDREAYELNNGRFTVWSMILSRPSFWITGCGLGNFHFAILPTYRGELTSWFYHAENIYLELLTDFGLIGFVIAMFGIVWLGMKVGQNLVQNRLYAPTMIASVFAISAIGLQSLVDFSLILPGIFLPAGALVGCFLGRCGAADFGRKSRNEKQHRGRKKGVEQHKSKISLGFQLVIASFILAVGFGGMPALRGFAVAEEIARELDQIDEQNTLSSTELLERIERTISRIDQATIDTYAWHPEVNLQLGRGIQAYTENLVENSSSWDSKWEKQVVSALSKPESIAATFRQTTPLSSELQELKEIAGSTKARQILVDSAQKMKIAAEVCSFDWRPAWGLFRSDLNLLTPESRAMNLSRLANLTNISASLPPKIGGSCLIAGERQTAFTLIKRYLNRSPNMSGRIAEGLINMVDKDELLELLPASPLVIASVAELLSKRNPHPEYVDAIVEAIDLENVFAEALKQRGNSPNQADIWMTIKSLAEKQKKWALLLDACRQHIQADPMRHDLRASFAELLAGKRKDIPIQALMDERKRIDEALSQAEGAARLAPGNTEYKKLATELRNAQNQLKQ